MAFVITETECDQIRAAIDIRLDPITLPNATILLGIYAGYAVQRIKDRLPADLDSAYDSKALTASIFSCAALLIPAIKQLGSETIAGNTKSFKFMDWDKKIQELEDRTNQILDVITQAVGGHSDFSDVRPTFFRTSKADRADRW